LFPIWGDDAGKAGKLLFARKEVFPLSPRPSHPFKKSEKTFLFTFTCLCLEQSLLKNAARIKLSELIHLPQEQ